MKTLYLLGLKNILIWSIFFSSQFIYGQNSSHFWAIDGNKNDALTTNKLGTLTPNIPLNIYAGGVQHMTILGGGTNAGFVGIGTTMPLAPLHIVGSGRATSDGWSKGILLTGEATVVWDKGSNSNYYFLGSSSRSGDMYAGLTNNIGNSGTVNYVYKTFGESGTGKPAPGVTQYFHNLLCNDSIGAGLGFLFPKRRIDSKEVSAPQLRLTQTDNSNVLLGVWTDFQTTSLGDLAINPRANKVARRMGINTNTPGNTLEINSILESPTTSNGVVAASPFKGNATGNSGLLFTDLSSASIPQANPGHGVLSVDGNGNVIYVSSGGGNTNNTGGIGFGGICGTKPTALTSNWEIPLSTFNYVFTGQNATGSNVGIGITNCAPAAKLDVLSSVLPIAGNFLSNLPNTTTEQINVGVQGRATASVVNVGVYGRTDDNTSENNTGGWFVSSNSPDENVGLFCEASGPSTATNYAMVAIGDVNINGSYFQNGSSFTSDQQFKTNIDTIKNALGIVKQLSPKTYYFDTNNTTGMNFPSQKQYGLIAQQVQTILPELVTSITKPAIRNPNGKVIHPALTYKTLNYNAFIAILMKGMQEQQKTIDSLKTIIKKPITNNQDSINTVLMSQNAALQTQLNQLANIINACCNATNSNGGSKKMMSDTTNQINVDLSNAQTVVLAQNVPNPFAEQTTISYFLPDNTSKAQILFYNSQGMLIQTINLTQTGNGMLNVFADDLSNGIYTYTLVVDGRIIDSKKMMKQ